MSIQIILVNHDTHYTFPKDKFISYFPKSMITTILEHDPEVEEIKITHPDVIPEALDILHSLVNREGDVPDTINNPEMLMKSGKYLLIDFLLLVANSYWPEVSAKYYPLIWVKPDRIRRVYMEIIHDGMHKNNGILEYLNNFISPDSVKDLDIRLMRNGIINQNEHLVKYCLKRINPYTDCEDNEFIKKALEMMNYLMIDLLLEDGRIRHDDS